MACDDEQAKGPPGQDQAGDFLWDVLTGQIKHEVVPILETVVLWAALSAWLGWRRGRVGESASWSLIVLV